MANFKRGRMKDSRSGCLMCKPHKANAEVGRERRRREREAFADDTLPVTNGGDQVDWCPDCGGTGRCPGHPDCHDENCVDGVCPLCSGSKIY
jgi:hypothetical protein